MRRTLNKLSRSYFLISQHSDWFATRDRAMGRSYWQRHFPHMLRAEEGSFGKMLSLCPASVFGATARLIPFCSATGLLVPVGLEKSHVQCSHCTELGACGYGSTRFTEQSNPPPAPPPASSSSLSSALQGLYTGIEVQHTPWTPNTRTAHITLQELSPASSTLVRHPAGRWAEREPD